MLETHPSAQSTIDDEIEVISAKNLVWIKVTSWQISGPVLRVLQCHAKILSEVLIHVQRKGKTTIMRTTDNLLTFADRLLMRSGISLTNWLSQHIPEEMAGDLCEIRHNLEENGRSSMMILLCVFAQAVLTLWGCFQIWLQSTISTDEETTEIGNLALALAN